MNTLARDLTADQPWVSVDESDAPALPYATFDAPAGSTQVYEYRDLRRTSSSTSFDHDGRPSSISRSRNPRPLNVTPATPRLWCLKVAQRSVLTTVARVSQGTAASVQLVDDIFSTDHIEWETTLNVGDVEFHCTKDGPFPDH
jgi:hypothetical protein